LRLVKSRLKPDELTHLDRGKTVHTVLLEALEKLRPTVALSSDPPPREWYPYLEETSNRDIMLKLYISEGTFNRTRRLAIRSLARVLEELEVSMN
jgi:hypothetical protein